MAKTTRPRSAGFAAAAYERRLLLWAALANVCVGRVAAFGRGGPASLCADPYPHHGGLAAQTTPSPFEIVIEPANYTSGANVTVTLRLKEDTTDASYFVGYQIAAHPVAGKWSDVQGEFVGRPQDSSLLYFFGTKGNCLTHNNSSRRTSVQMVWRAPSSAAGDMLFSATVMTDYKTFWVNVTALLASTGVFNASFLAPVRQISAAPLESIDAPFASCGAAKTCLLWPRTCTDPSQCDVALAYSSPSAGNVRFQMSAVTPGYVSLGLSLDKKMDNDETLTCIVTSSGRLLLQRGYNPGYNNQRVADDLVTNITMRYENGRLYCDFVRPSFAYVTVTSNRKTTMYPFDLSQAGKYYLYVGWGPVYPGSYDSLMKHDVLPVVSAAPMNMSVMGTFYFNSLPTEIQVHITLMMLAWIGLSSMATVVARYFRSSVLNAKRINGKLAWLQIHRGMTFAAAPLTIAGFVLVFAYMRGWSKTAAVHAGFGVAVTALMVLQSTVALCRPRPTSSRRRVFAWFHRVVGGASLVCAATCVLLGVNITYMPPRLALWGNVVSGLWIGLQVLFMLSLDVLQCFAEQRNAEPSATAGDMMVDDKMESGSDRGRTLAGLKSALLVVYLLCMTALVAAGVAYAWAY